MPSLRLPPLLLAGLAFAAASVRTAGAHTVLPLGRTLLQNGGACEKLRATLDRVLANIERLNNLIETANENGEPQAVTRSLLGQLSAAKAKRAATLRALERKDCPDEPPIITCPDDITVEQGTDQAITATATDFEDDDATLQVSCDPANTSALSGGTTTVTCTATDSAGNTATCDVEVTVTEPRSCTPRRSGTFGTAPDTADGTLGNPVVIPGCRTQGAVTAPDLNDCAAQCAAFAGAVGCLFSSELDTDNCLRITELDDTTTTCADNLASSPNACNGVVSIACPGGEGPGVTIEEADCISFPAPFFDDCQTGTVLASESGAAVTPETCLTLCAQSATEAAQRRTGDDRICVFTFGAAVFGTQNVCSVQDPPDAVGGTTLNAFEDCDIAGTCNTIEIVCT